MGAKASKTDVVQTKPAIPQPPPPSPTLPPPVPKPVKNLATSMSGDGSYNNLPEHERFLYAECPRYATKSMQLQNRLMRSSMKGCPSETMIVYKDGSIGCAATNRPPVIEKYQNYALVEEEPQQQKSKVNPFIKNKGHIILPIAFALFLVMIYHRKKIMKMLKKKMN